MVKKETLLRVVIVLLFSIGTILVLLPLLKTGMVSYLIETRIVHQTSSVPSNVGERKEWIQPPTLGEVLKSYGTTSEFSSVGRVVVPDVAINTPIFSELTNENLFLGSGIMFPSRDPLTENMVLIGHHLSDENLLFGSLPQVTKGATIYLEYLHHYYQYEVDEIITVKDTEVQVMDNQGKGEITLITCDKASFTNYRVIVKGHLVPEKSQNSMQKEIAKAQTKSSIRHNKVVTFLGAFKWVLLIFLSVLVLSTIIVKKFI